MKTRNIIIIFFLAAFYLTITEKAFCEDLPYIARWYQNYEGAVSLRFDDALESHITKAIPLLNRYGFRATFMVVPGRNSYRTHKDFWEKQVPAMGHRLGNHTMNHRGARNLKDADYEIGETARIIWRIYPHESKLLVFASGGGKKWGGKYWEQAEPAYRQLTDKYHLIDLYDGEHQTLGINSKSKTDELCDCLDKIIAKKAYQPFGFHDVGSHSFINYILTFLRGYDLMTTTKTFSGFLHCLAERKHRLWIAPLIDILKYQEEAHGATLSVLKSNPGNLTIALAVRTDPTLYDHKLTLVLPVRRGMTAKGVRQDNEECQLYQRNSSETLVDIKPLNSRITIRFNVI